MEETIKCEENEDVEMEDVSLRRPRLLRRQSAIMQKKICAKEERNASLKRISLILQKTASERSVEENQVLLDCPETVEEIQERRRKRNEVKKRQQEVEDPEDVLNQKCQILAQAIAQSRHLVVYTGAGISTSANIPDYRGPNGIWTRIKEGRDVGEHNLTSAEPTFTHMALYELYKQNILKYVVSQNCDGLHLRSGLPRTALSELHGNMYIEVCKSCKKEYWRLFDVTENTARYFHKTSRRCYNCNEALVDTIVHFGERGSLQWPINWKGAFKNAKEATTIICIGSSLKVLKKYPWLWQMDKPVRRRPNLYIVNLQWTPKDDCANVKINGKCDVVMEKVMTMLGIEVTRYSKQKDPIFEHATLLNNVEFHTMTQPLVEYEEVQNMAVEDCFSNDSDLRSLVPDCDKPKCLPMIKKEKPNTSFMMDDILSSPTIEHSVNLVPQQALYEPFSFLNYNFLHRQFLGVYSDFFWYPYQTSFLYSGLHSIINTMPAAKEEDFFPKLKIEKKLDPECEYCDKNYSSLACLFYKKSEPVFANQLTRKSKLTGEEKPNICVCCDCSTEEEDINEDCEDRDQVKGKIQPGWFGKGYKKGRRKRKAV